MSQQLAKKTDWVGGLLALAVLGAAGAPGGGSKAYGQEVAEPPAPQRDPGGLMDRAAENGMPVYVDDSFASVEELRKAQRYVTQGQSQLAINSFQEIINNYGQKLVYLNDNSYVSITDYVREKLLAMPAVRQGMYDQLYGAQAQRSIDAAIERRDLAELIRVSDRFFPSTAALAGLSKAAEWYFERGEFSAASRTWQLLLSHPAAARSKADLLFRAAAAEALAHNTEAAKKLRARLEAEAPGATGKVSGEEVPLAKKLDEIMALPAWESVDLAKDEWPAFGGGPSRSRLLDVNASIGARLWGVTFGEETTAAASGNAENNARIARLRIQTRGLGSADLDSPMLGEFPVLSNGMLFIHTGDRVMAISANAGTVQWSYPSQPGAAASSREAVAVQLAMAGIPYRPVAHDSATVYGNQVFAILSAAGGTTRAIRTNIDVEASLGGASRVVCIGRDDGREIWSRSSDAVKIDNKGALVFVGSPTVTRQGVFVIARKAADGAFTQQYLIRLDRETGDVTWSCYLCSTSSGAMYGLPSAFSGSIAVPAIVDDIVYITTGQGADCAVDANAGRILWLRVVDGDKNGRPPGQFYNPAIQMTPAWKCDPPVIAGDRMVVKDNANGSLRVYNRWNGKLLRTVKSDDLDGFRFDVMAGAIGPHLILSGGERTLSLDLDKLADPAAEVKPEWWVDVASQEAGKLQGRPFLTSNAYYVPFERKLVRIDPLAGRSTDVWPWPNTEKDTPGKPGNLLVTSEQVIVVNDTEVAGYSKWETARDNRLAKIRETPRDPEPYLALAEISFRTNHQDLAQENMKKAVDLANADAGAGDILRRLYKTNLNFAEQLLQKNDVPLRDQARFYYDEARASARDPEQQSEWRLRKAELSLKQKRQEEAATLYSEILTDPALRSASYHEGDIVASAGAIAEQRLRKIAADNREIYRRFEDQAAGLLQKGRSQRDLAMLEQVMEGYPNSESARAAAMDLASAYRDRRDWKNSQRVLWWLQPRVEGAEQASVIAGLVQAALGLKKFPTAAAWAARGERRFKDAPVLLGNQEVTFASLKNRVAEELRNAGDSAAFEGRLPAWHPDPDGRPVMDGNGMRKNELLGRELLVPVETSPQYRPPDVLLTHGDGKIYVYEAATGKKRFESGIELPSGLDQPMALLGIVADHAIILERDKVLGVHLRTRKIWTQSLATVSGLIDLRQQMRQRIEAVNGPLAVQEALVQIDGRQAPGAGEADLELMRQASIERRLGNPNFNSVKLINNRIYIIAGMQLSAFDAATGEPAWPDPLQLPAGLASCIVGNEDVIAVQIDPASAPMPRSALDRRLGEPSTDRGTGSLFYVIDADAGKFRKQFRLESEHVNWRAVGDDGTLYTVTEQTAAAYDLVGNQNTPLWQRGLETRFASASLLTLDGLLIVDSSLNASCLSLESGEMKWPHPIALRLDSSTGATTVLRSALDGDSVIYQSRECIVSFKVSGGEASAAGKAGGAATAPAARQDGDPPGWWKGTYPVGDKPPLDSLQLSDLYVMELAAGPVNTASQMVKIIIRDHKGGKLFLGQQLIRESGGNEGPNITSWEVLDGGIAFETGATVHFWRNLEFPAVEPAKNAP